MKWLRFVSTLTMKLLEAQCLMVEMLIAGQLFSITCTNIKHFIRFMVILALFLLLSLLIGY